jgi:dienelactone hydrolase
METRSIIRYWALFGALAFLGFSIIAGPQAGPILAQKPGGAAKPSQSDKDQQDKNQQGGVPADHFDPDDTKTYEDVVSEDRQVSVRGQQFTVHFYRPTAAGTAVPAIYACGDGGWRGLAPRTAEQLAHVGFAVAGIDSKVYLRQFSSPQNPLTIKMLASDYSEIAKSLREYANADSHEPVYVYGWSLGAGFAVAVGSDSGTRANWAGIISDYLTTFASSQKPVTPEDLARDYAAIIDAALLRPGVDPKAPITLAGWSLGAGYSVLVSSDDGLKPRLNRVVAISLPVYNELAWKPTDALIYITHGTPREKVFEAQQYLRKLAPVSLVMLNATNDDTASLTDAQSLFNQANGPKFFYTVNATGHHFEGGETEFYRDLDQSFFKKPTITRLRLKILAELRTTA